ncbi:LacI family DNA-binding transcriptional regulator [Bilifractor sp. LCP21S3_A7]|uniref:LacI family DNA-binding transcriptional regulator n=1 Tax=Bilifractor sp. LCP21S3_A7 TaxID=3438738 RepID=UPI003F911118
MSGIQDVAKRAGVSIGTVSRVLNKSGYASEESREKVEAAVRELNYRPNQVARNLLHKKTQTVAMVVPEVANPFFAQLIAACERELRTQGYKTLICATNGHKSNEQLYLDMLSRNLVDGILTCTHSLQTAKYQEAQGAIVSFDTIHVPGQITRIRVDHKKGGELAARELIRCGCRKVLQFRDRKPIEHFPFIERHEVFERVMNEAGIECINVIVKWNEFEDCYLQDLVRDCYEKYPDVDGVFGTDPSIVHYMRYVMLHGIRIPQDIRFVAYDGSMVRDMAFPTLTAIKQPINELAKRGVEALLAKIRGEILPEDDVILPVEFIRGMTTMTDAELAEFLADQR